MTTHVHNYATVERDGISEYDSHDDSTSPVSGKRIASSAKGGDTIWPCAGTSTHAAGRADRTGYIDMYMHPIRCSGFCCVLPRRFRALGRSRSVAKMTIDVASNSVYKSYTNVLGCWCWLAAAIECRRLASIAEPQRLLAAHTLNL